LLVLLSSSFFLFSVDVSVSRVSPF
jgi:hypothetical protein